MSLIVSQGSGATIATELLGGSHYQQMKVVDGTNGSSNKWLIDSTGAGLFSTNNLMSLASGTTVLTKEQNLISLASGTQILANQSGTWTVQPGNTPNTSPWLVTQSGGLISLASGTNVQATQSGSWDIRSALSLASIYGNVGIVGTPTVNVNGLISLASGTSVLTSFSGVISLASGTNIIPQGYNSGGVASLASGFFGNLQLDNNSIQKINLAYLIAGENLTTNKLNNEPIYSTNSITTQTTTTIKSAAGTLAGFLIPTPVASATIKIYDNTAASGTVLVDTITFPATLISDGPIFIKIDALFATGLTVITAGATMAVDIYYR